MADKVKMTRKPKGYKDDTRLGIINPYGDIWTSDTFETEAEARAHIEHFWKDIKDVDTRRFRVIPVRVHVTPLGLSLLNGDENEQAQ